MAGVRGNDLTLVIRIRWEFGVWQTVTWVFREEWVDPFFLREFMWCIRESKMKEPMFLYYVNVIGLNGLRLVWICVVSLVLDGWRGWQKWWFNYMCEGYHSCWTHFKAYWYPDLPSYLVSMPRLIVDYKWWFVKTI